MKVSIGCFGQRRLANDPKNFSMCLRVYHSRSTPSRLRLES